MELDIREVELERKVYADAPPISQRYSGGVLGHPMGSGKTRIVLALTASDPADAPRTLVLV